MSATAPPDNATPAPVNRHAMTAAETQRAQLARLLKDPAKPAFVPEAPKQKTIRPAREMMKNVQGSSAGAGSGEFHVYKANRRREYERLKIMEEEVEKETAAQEFERKRRERDEAAEAKTAKNRAKRQKKKQGKKAMKEGATSASASDQPVKKRRLISGQEVIFRNADASEGEDSSEGERPAPDLLPASQGDETEGQQTSVIAEPSKITIIEDD